MIDLKTILIPEILLTPLHGEAKAKSSASAISNGAALDGTPYRRPYLNYVVLTHFHEKIPSKWQSDSLILYNRYYWFLQFAKIHSDQFGRDAGIEQQSFQILENAVADIDWAVVEAIDKQVHHQTRNRCD